MYYFVPDSHVHASDHGMSANLPGRADSAARQREPVTTRSSRDHDDAMSVPPELRLKTSCHGGRIRNIGRWCVATIDLDSRIPAEDPLSMGYSCGARGVRCDAASASAIGSAIAVRHRRARLRRRRWARCRALDRHVNITGTAIVLRGPPKARCHRRIFAGAFHCVGALAPR
jgi:hypothetical protein